MSKGLDKPPKSRVLLEVRVPRAWIAGLVAALGLMLVLAAVGFSAVNRIEACDMCHVVEAEVATYKQTAHYTAGVGCQQCHTKPGVFYYFIRNLQGLSNVLTHVSDSYQRPVTAYVGADNCLQCHTNEEIERDLVVGNIRVNHTGLREAGYQCLTCHANISHPGTQLEVARVSQNVMSVCAECHDGETLPDDCEVCHIGGVPAEHRSVTMSVKVSAEGCESCHKGGALCRSCHNGLQMPHPSAWESRHGDTVVDRGKSICASCHTKKDPKFCIDCHGVVMPHPSGFGTGHGSFALANEQKCVKCHGKNSCISCHGLAMPHPSGWQSGHTSAGRSSPGLCSRCHSASECSSCHGVSLPHSSAFRADHSSSVYANGGVCVKCHGNRGAGPSGCYGGECHSNGFEP
jgi:nitrate/TMAO reductase-like tetraheme cytochrome c subunit